MGYIIVDLDNCISDDAWRVPHILWNKENMDDRWDLYHSLSARDHFCNRHIIERYPRLQVIVVTGRPKVYKFRTMVWLEKNKINFVHLLMSQNNEIRNTAAMKMKMVQDLMMLTGIKSQQIYCAYDDRMDVIEAYRSIGLNAEQLYINDPNQYERSRDEAAGNTTSNG